MKINIGINKYRDGANLFLSRGKSYTLGKVQALGGTVRRVRKLKIMSKERTKRLKILIKDLYYRVGS